MTYTTKTWNPVETDTQTGTSTVTDKPWADSMADKVHEDPSAHLKIQVQRPGLEGLSLWGAWRMSSTFELQAERETLFPKTKTEND